MLLLLWLLCTLLLLLHDVLLRAREIEFEGSMEVGEVDSCPTSEIQGYKLVYFVQADVRGSFPRYLWVCVIDVFRVVSYSI